MKPKGMPFDTLVAKCPNPCCYADMILVRQSKSFKVSTFRCPSSKCYVGTIQIKVRLSTEKINKLHRRRKK